MSYGDDPEGDTYRERHGDEPTGDTPPELIEALQEQQQARADDLDAPEPLDGPNVVYRTKTGKIITEAMIEAWVAEAEAGYDLPRRKLRYEIDGLPDDLPSGTYTVRFSGMVEYPTAGEPVVRFKVQSGPWDLSDAEQAAMAELERRRQQIYAGEPLTDIQADIMDRVARGAHELTEHERETLEGQMAVTRAEGEEIAAGATLPDLYQVSTVETLNVSKLARVIGQLLRMRVIKAHHIGLSLDNGESWDHQIERWLRS